MHSRRHVLTTSMTFLSALLICTSGLSPTAWAEPDLAKLKMVRLLENDDVIHHEGAIPGRGAGVAFPPGARSVIKLVPRQAANRPAEAANVTLLTGAPAAPAAFAVSDPINITSDPTTNAPSLLIYKPENRELTLIIGAQITSADAAHVDIKDPQGMTFDGRTLYVSDGKELVNVEIGRLSAGSAFPRAVKQANIKRWDLRTVVDGGRPRGIAFNPQDGSLYLFIPGTEEIVKVTTTGRLVDRREVQDFDMTNLKSVVFAPSSDRTDAKGNFNLFVVTGGSDNGEHTEWSLN